MKTLYKRASASAASAEEAPITSVEELFSTAKVYIPTFAQEAGNVETGIASTLKAFFETRSSVGNNSTVSESKRKLGVFKSTTETSKEVDIDNIELLIGAACRTLKALILGNSDIFDKPDTPAVFGNLQSHGIIYQERVQALSDISTAAAKILAKRLYSSSKELQRPTDNAGRMNLALLQVFYRASLHTTELINEFYAESSDGQALSEPATPSLNKSTDFSKFRFPSLEDIEGETDLAELLKFSTKRSFQQLKRDFDDIEKMDDPR